MKPRSYKLSSPIDFNWELLPTLEEILAKLPLANSNKKSDISKEGLMELYYLAKQDASKLGWEQNFRIEREPRILFLPGDGEFSPCFVWGHDNNGDCFFICPNHALDQFDCVISGAESL